VKSPVRLFLPSAALCLFLPAVPAQTILSGPVTNPGTPDHFTVNSTTILCSPTTQNVTVLEQQTGKKHIVNGCPARVLGEAVTVTGKPDKTHALLATAIETEDFEATRVDGNAVIERVETSASGTITIQSDGYRIRITPKTKTVRLEPLNEDATIAPNLWLRYSGTQEIDGTVTATTATLSANQLTNRQQKLNQKQEFDPSAVTEKDRQGAASRFLLGTNAKRFPAWNDAAMQQRVEVIGAKLIPAVQRTLPGNDPAKLNFRFQVVDKDKLKDAMTLTNGIILVPRQVIERLQNDAQLATVLADNIACAMEKQNFRQLPANDFMAGASVAATAASFFVPGLGIATGISESVAGKQMLKHAEEQSGRVSLSLLHDAGYDITQAPITWWLLDSKKPLAETTMPYRARYLYGQLATTWRNETEAANQGHTNPALITQGTAQNDSR